MTRTLTRNASLTVDPSALLSTPPARVAEGQFVAQLGSAGLGAASYVVGADEAPTWIVMEYGTHHDERIWRRTGAAATGHLAYAMFEDTSSRGYVTSA